MLYKRIGVEVIKCSCHRVNSAVLWSLGIPGAAAHWKNKAMGELMKKQAARVVFFSHYAVNNGMPKEPQKLEEDLRRIYELIKRNDKVICILNFVFVLCSSWILWYSFMLQLKCTKYFKYFYTPFLFFSR